MASILEAFSNTPPTTTTLTVTGLSSLATNTSVTSNLIDNHAGLYTDCIVQANLTSGSSGTSATGYVEVYLSASLDNIVFPGASNDILIATSYMSANSTAYPVTFSCAKGLQGVLPPYFKLRFNNQSGGTLSAAAVVYDLAFNTVA